MQAGATRVIPADPAIREYRGVIRDGRRVVWTCPHAHLWQRSDGHAFYGARYEDWASAKSCALRELRQRESAAS